MSDQNEEYRVTVTVTILTDRERAQRLRDDLSRLIDDWHTDRLETVDDLDFYVSQLAEVTR